MGLFNSLFGKRYETAPTNKWRMPNPLDPRTNGPALIDTQGQQAAREEQNFWQGGDKFRGKDAIAAALAAISDAFDRSGRGGAVDMLAGSRFSARDMAMKQAQQEQERAALMQAAQARGINPADVTLAQGGLGGLVPKPEEPTAFMRNEQYVGQKYGQDAGRAYAAPALYGMAQGPDGRYYPKTSGPALDPNEWEPIDEGGAGPQAPRPFRYGR